MNNNVYYFSSLTDNQPKAVAWETVATEIRSDKLADICRQYRALLPEHDAAVAAGDNAARKAVKAKMTALKNQCSAFMPQVTLDGGRAATNVTGYRPFMIVDIDHIPPEQLESVERMVKDDEHSKLAYVTVSGRGLRVIAQVEGEIDETNFRDAWLSVNEYYKRLTGLDYDSQCSSNTRMSGLSCDPKAVFRPHPKTIKVEHEEKAKKQKGPAAKAEKAGKVARELVDGEGREYEEGQRNDYVARCLYWMNRFGVEAADAEKWAKKEFNEYDEANGFPITSMVKSIYKKHKTEFHTCRPSAFSQQANHIMKASIPEIEAWLTARFEFRKNMLTHCVEICRRDAGKTDGETGDGYREVDDAEENTLWCDMHRAGINVDMQSLHTLLQSRFVPNYNPLAAYLDSLPEWDGGDHIGRFLSMVHCRGTTAEQFDHYVRRWLVAMVAAALDDTVVNHEIFVLLGEQGTYKSSFMNNILPPELRQYYCTKTNSNRMTKDDSFALTENLLINMEEIDSMQREEVNQLKAMASQIYVKDRPAYGRSKVRLPHTASFCATGNNLQFLTDDTGNRRWLVFEVDHIDNPWTTEIDYRGIYSHIRHLLKSKFKYWFDMDEIRELNAHNRQFETPNLARELIATRYRQPVEMEMPLYLTASDIVARFGGSVRLSAVQVGKALGDLGFEQTRTRHGRFWKLYERESAEIGRVIPGMDAAGDAAPIF